METYQIINQLNDLLCENEDIGETVIDFVIEQREEEGLPPFTPDELAAAKAECEANGRKMDEIWDKIHELEFEYELQTGKYPVLVDCGCPFFREAWSFDE